jgi:hypothetical protein
MAREKKACLFRTDERAQAACAAAAANSEARGEKDHQCLAVAAREHREEAEKERIDELDQQRPEIARKPACRKRNLVRNGPAFLFELSCEQQRWFDLPSQAQDKTKGKVPRIKRAHLPSLSESRPKASAAITSALLFIAITAPTNAGLISRATASAVNVPVV